MNRHSICIIFLISALFSSLFAQEDSDNATTQGTEVSNEFDIRVKKVRDSIFMLTGKGGNIGLFIGADGAFLIDDKFPESTSNILNAVSKLSLQPVQFLINTHFHPDHTGGNKNMREAGITIFAHTNVRKRLRANHEAELINEMEASIGQKVEKAREDGNPLSEKEVEKDRMIKKMTLEAIDERILPMITFEEDLTFHYNEQDIHVFHIQNAHTDGDVMVYFTESNVLHTGDAFIKGLYPFIDSENGGSYAGYIRGLEKLLALIDDNTLIIPGHGDVATKADVRYTKSMMDFVYNSVSFHRIDKKTEDQVLAMKEITKEFDEKGFGSGFISTEDFVRSAYKEAANKYRWIDKNKGGQ